MSNVILQIKQLAHRLESTVSSERVEALQELQTLGRSDPASVGDIALASGFKILREHGNPEEYTEALDLTSRLISCSDKTVARKNSSIILADARNIELLLELLEHEDLTVGVMTSQVLTEIYAANRESLEAAIQQCPDGMIKLIQRLPDSSREEVRNQAIVLVQHLTSKNEEIKKTVAFNEGFEVIFKIIRDEGGSGDAGLVINDCLRICSNLLHNSETCQRLFFAMGTEWIRQLAEFFNPAALENPDKVKSHLVDAEHAMEQFCWFEESGRLSCAILAMTALAHALDPVSTKHQNTILNNASVVISHAAFWVARGGPSELVSAAMSVLLLVCRGNVHVAQTIATTVFVKVPPTNKGRNVPADAETSPLLFGWRASPHDESRFVSPLSLFGERYLHPVSPWDPPSGRCFDVNLEVVLQVGKEDMTLDFQLGCLQVFSAILSADTSVPDIMIQFVLAPPPPPMMDMDDDDGFGNGQMVMETMKPIAGILVNMVAQVCERTLSANHMYTGVSAASFKTDLDVGERALHLLSIVFLNASQLGRELITAISSSHLQNLSGMQEKGRNMHDNHDHKQILSFFLASAGKAARVPGGGGYHFLSCLLQLLAVIASGCERAVAQMFDDPANLFVVDLATSSSEHAGVPAPVQLSVCFFLGCCFTALPKDKKDSESDSGSILQRKTFLAMIDSKVGLNRFTEILKRPAMIAKKQHTEIGHLHQYGNYFASIDSFKDFFLTQTEAIKTAIFELYSGVDTSDGSDSVHQQVILMQQEKIKELEGKLAGAHPSANAAAAHPEGMVLIDQHEIERLKAELAKNVSLLDEANARTRDAEKQLEASLSETDSVRLYLQEVEKENSALKNSHDALVDSLKQKTQQYEALDSEASALRATRAKGDEGFAAMKEELAKLQQAEQVHRSLLREKETALEEMQSVVDQIRKDLDSKNDEIIELKKMVLTESAAKDNFAEQLDKRDMKLQLMEQELLSLRSSADAGAQIASYVARIEELQKAIDAKSTTVGDLQGQLAQLRNQADENASKEKNYKRVLEEKSELIAELQSQVLDLTTQLSDDGGKVQPTAISSSASAMQELREIVNDTLALCDIEDTTFIQADMDALQNANTMTEDTVVSLTALLRFQYNSISTCAGTISDITEGANLPLEGHEGSLTRVLTSCQSLRRQMFSLEEIIQNNDTAYLQEQIESLQGEIELLQTEKGDLMGRVDELEGDVDRLNTSQTEDSMVKDDMQVRLQKLLQENKTVRGLVEALKTERDNLAKEKDTITSDLQVNVKNLSDLLKAKEDEAKLLLQEHDAQLDEMRYKLRHAESCIQELDKGNQDLLAERDSFQVNISFLQASLKESEEKRMELSRQLEQQISDMKLELTDCEVLQVKIKELTVGKQRLEKENSEISQQRHSLEQRLAAKESELSNLASERDYLQSEVSSLQSVLNESEQRQVELSRQLEQQIRDMKLELVDYADLQLKLKDLTAVVQSLESDKSELSERYQSLEQRLASKEMELSVKQDEIHEVSRKLEAAQLNTPSLHNEISLLQSKLTSAAAEKSAIEKDLKKQKKAYEQSVASAQELYESKLLEVTHLENSLVELEKEKREVADTLQKELDQLREEVLEGQSAALNTSIELSESLQREREDFQQQLLETSMMHENLELTLKAEIEELKASLSLQKHLASTHAAAFHQEKHELATQLGDCKQLIRDLEASIEEAVNARSELQITVRELQSDKVNAEKLITGYIADLQSASSTSESLREKIAVLEKELETAKLTRSAVSHTPSAQPTIDYARRIETLEQVIEERDKDLLAKEQEIKRRTREMDQMKLILNKQVEEIRAIKEQQQQQQASTQPTAVPRTPTSSVKYRRTDDLESSPGPNGFVVQEHELRRISAASDRLSKDLIQKEAELRETVALLRRREGELAGLKMSFESVKEEIKSVRQENDKLMEERMSQEQMLRQLSGKIDVLKSSTFSEASRASSSISAERSAIWELTRLLQTLESQYGAKHSSWKENGHDLNKVVANLQSTIQETLTKLKDEVSQKDKELSGMRASTRAGSSPYRTTPTKSEASNLSSVLVTPTKQQEGGALSQDAAAWQSIMSASKYASPSAPGAARLHTELLREKKKFHTLEEQHTDLLGLLAQQEVELSVYRQAISDKVGDSGVSAIERMAQDSVARKYGSYTSMRDFV